MKPSLTPQIMKATELTEQKPQLFYTGVGWGGGVASPAMLCHSDSSQPATEGRNNVIIMSDHGRSKS